MHERLGVAHGLGIVVVTKALVTRESSSDRFVSTIHGHQVDVDVHQEVALGCTLVDLNVFAVIGLSKVDQVRGVLCVVLHEQAVRSERVVDPRTESMAQLGFGHPSVQRKGGNKDDVIDSGLGRLIKDGFDHHLTDVRSKHRRKWQ